MKKIYLILLLVFGLTAFGQQKGISYQAVIINPNEIIAPGFNGTSIPLANKVICLSFQIVNSANQIEYQESQSIATDAYGMVNLVIGTGRAGTGLVSTLEAVAWNQGNKKLVVGVNIDGACSNYTEISNQILNYTPYSFYALNADLKDGYVTTAKLANGVVTDAKVAMGINPAKVGLGNVDNTSDLNKPMSTATKIYVDSQLTSSTIVDADATTKGKIQLAGDLAGTAAAPTVPGLALKENAANKSTVVTLGTSNDLFPTQNAVKTYVDTAISGATIADADTTTKGKIKLGGDLAGTADAPTIGSNAITTAKVADQAITDVKIASVSGAKISGNISGNATNVTGVVGVTNGGTGATTITAARTNLGLGSAALNNTSDFEAPLTFTSPIIRTVNSIAVPPADATVNGYLKASDFYTFTNKINSAEKAANNGVATLGNDGKIPSSQIPAISFQSVNVVNSQAAMIANSAAQVGSITIRTDINRNFVLSNLPASTLSNWIELSTPTSVTSVNGYAGPNVSLTKADINLGNVDNTSDNNKPISIDTRAALDLKANIASPTFTGTVSGITKSMVGLGNVDNTTDAGKPVSTATQSALDLKANTADVTTSLALKENSANKSTATDLGSTNPSDILFPSQKAVKTYVDMQSANAGVADGSITSAKILDGTLVTADLADGGVTTAKLATNAVTTAKISDANVTNAKLDKVNIPLSGFGAAVADIAIGANKLTGVADPSMAQDAATKNYVDIAIAGATIVDADATTKGKIQLTGDLAGTAGAPTVPGLALKENTANKSTTATLGTSDILFPTQNAVKTYADAKVVDGITDAETTSAPTQNAVFDALALKANTPDVTTSLGLKEDAANKTLNLTSDGASDIKFPSAKAVKTYADAKVADGIADAETTSAPTQNAVFDALALKANTADVTTSLGLKEDAANKTLNLTSDGASDIKFPSAKAVKTYADAKVADGIADAETTSAPTQNAVFDALDLKAPKTSPTFTGTVTSPIYASAPQTLTDAATISWNPANGLNANVTLGGNRSLSFSSTPAAGSYGTLVITQDATGGRTITLPSTSNKILGSSSTTTIALSAAANAKDILNFYYDGTYCYWNVGQGFGTTATFTPVNLVSDVIGTLPITAGGTGSTTQNFVDLSTLQTIGGNKTFNSDIKVNGLTIGMGVASIFSNTTVGYQALNSNTTGIENTAVGYRALRYNTTGNSNLAFGNNTLTNNTTGSNNTAMGNGIMTNNTTGGANTAVGSGALQSNTNNNNTAIGYASLLNNNAGNGNTAVGVSALQNNISGTNNTAMGYNALQGATGTYNTAVGNGARVLDGATTTNATAIGNGAYALVSNTIQLGNTSVTNVKTSGTVTAGTVTYPNAHNSIAGQVLTTDASGVASWAQPSVPSTRSWTDQPATVSANQTTFTLTYAPPSTVKVWMFINGVRTNNNAYSFSGTTVTYVPANNGGYAITASDRIQFDYTY